MLLILFWIFCTILKRSTYIIQMYLKKRVASFWKHEALKGYLHLQKNYGPTRSISLIDSRKTPNNACTHSSQSWGSLALSDFNPLSKIEWRNQSFIHVQLQFLEVWNTFPLREAPWTYFIICFYNNIRSLHFKNTNIILLS